MIFKFGYIGQIIFLVALGALLYGKYYIFTEGMTPLGGLYNLACAIVGMLGIAVMFRRRKNNKNKWI